MSERFRAVVGTPGIPEPAPNAIDQSLALAKEATEPTSKPANRAARRAADRQPEKVHPLLQERVIITGLLVVLITVLAALGVAATDIALLLSALAPIIAVQQIAKASR